MGENIFVRPYSIFRFYLLDKKVTRKLDENFKKYLCDYCMSSETVETYYDTSSSSLSSLECILMKDSKSSNRYWKFFSFAHDNIMEITTDEKEIREPLSRILQYDSPDYITNDLLRPFFSICITSRTYIVGSCRLQVTVTDYGFAFCSIEKICISPNRFVEGLLEIESLARKLGLKNLAKYEPKVYL